MESTANRIDVDVVLWLELLDPEEMKDQTAIVVDVLRASSTITTALHVGFESVAAVESVSEARALGKSREGKCCFGGERGGVKIPGFSFGNSPLEYLDADPNELSGKTLIFTTTNGTKAILKSKLANTVLIGSILNAGATVRAALRRGDDVTVLCAGTEGMFSADDFLAAGLLVERLVSNAPDYFPPNDPPQMNLSDSAMAALGYWQANRNDPATEMKSCWHGRRMQRLGFTPDIDFCSKVDAFDIVAQFNNELGLIFRP